MVSIGLLKKKRLSSTNLYKIVMWDYIKAEKDTNRVKVEGKLIAVKFSLFHFMAYKNFICNK